MRSGIWYYGLQLLWVVPLWYGKDLITFFVEFIKPFERVMTFFCCFAISLWYIIRPCHQLLQNIARDHFTHSSMYSTNFSIFTASSFDQEHLHEQIVYTAFRRFMWVGRFSIWYLTFSLGPNLLHPPSTLLIYWF